MAQREEGVRVLTSTEGVTVADVPLGDRNSLDVILEESFEGWYLRHSKGTLREVEVVRAAFAAGTPVGLTMLKALEPSVGYVYYIAVAPSHRRTGVASLLLDDAISRFEAAGAKEVFAGVEEENEPSKNLFESKGFVRTSFGEVSRRHGALHAINMYRVMRIVPGEILLRKTLA